MIIYHPPFGCFGSLEQATREMEAALKTLRDPANYAAFHRDFPKAAQGILELPPQNAVKVDVYLDDDGQLRVTAAEYAEEEGAE